MAAQSLSIPEDHPLVLELNSLRSAVARYQHEAHAAAVNLQRQSLEASHTLHRCRALEYQNGVLEGELIALRANPDTTASTAASSQVAELTLALRKLSDKLTLTEEMLLSRTSELVDTRSELARLQYELDNVHALAVEARAREQAASEQEREIERRLHASEEERRMAELVIQEYADLVRNLEGRKKSISSLTSPTPPEASDKNNSSLTLVDSLTEGRYGLQKLLEEHNIETERFAQENFKLRGEIAILTSNLEVERQGAEHDREQLSIALHELEKYKVDDNTAAKMVSRYMKFSQTATDSLQKAMESQKERHAATLSTMSAEIAELRKTLSSERQQTMRLRDALDELSEDLSRESYGRRREISLRLALLAREERFVEGLSRLLRKVKETSTFINTNDPESLNRLQDVLNNTVLGVENILQSLDGELSSDEVPPGSVARVIASRDAVSNLIREMQVELDKRLVLERELSLLITTPSPRVNGAVEALSDPKTESTPLIELEDAPQASLSSSREVDITIPSASYPSGVKADDSTQETTQHSLRDLPIPTTEASELPIADVEKPLPVVSSQNPEPTSSHLTTAEFVPSSESPPIRSTGIVTDADIIVDTISHESPVHDTHIDSPSTNDTRAMSDPKGSDGVTQKTIVANTIGFPTVEAAASSDQVIQISVPVSPQSIPLPPSQTYSSSSISREAPLRRSHPILNELHLTKHRYNATQRGFRDCHLALKDLKVSIMTLTSSNMSFAIQKAVERLDDFSEDARVELEIRIADEERLVAGYEALLSIPGAISDEVNDTDLDTQIRAFVDGTDPTVAKNVQQFAHKLDDLQHDIARIKMVVHEASSSDNDDASVSNRGSSGWSSWTAGLLTPTRPVSPGPTFGSVMTSPRLRHSSSFTRPRKQSTDSLAPGSELLANLGLRISMPSQMIPSPHSLPSRQPSSRLDPRPRTTSGLHMLGLGKRNTSFAYSINPTGSLPVSRMPSTSGGQPMQNDDNDNRGDVAEALESDVE